MIDAIRRGLTRNAIRAAAVTQIDIARVAQIAITAKDVTEEIEVALKIDVVTRAIELQIYSNYFDILQLKLCSFFFRITLVI